MSSLAVDRCFFLLFANEGTLWKKQEEELGNQAGCLNLVTNAAVTWNTVYMAVVIEQLRAEGKTVNEEDIARLSPARYEHINPHGKYRFEVEAGLSRTRLRPLRQPTEHQSRWRSLFFAPLLSEAQLAIAVTAAS